MPLTKQDKGWHAKFEAMPEGDRDAIRKMYKNITEEMQYCDLNAYGDDRAESLVAAIARYVIECNPEEWVGGEHAAPVSLPQSLADAEAIARAISDAKADDANRESEPFGGEHEEVWRAITGQDD